MPKRTDLASGTLNNSGRLVVELIEPKGTPPIITIDWPEKSTICTPTGYDAVLASAVRLLAAASLRGAAAGRGQY